MNRTPIAKCPKCKHSIMYSFNPKSKKSVIVRIADDNYKGNTILCSKCKSMLSVIVKPIVAKEYVTVPIYRLNDFNEKWTILLAVNSGITGEYQEKYYSWYSFFIFFKYYVNNKSGLKY